MDSANKIEREMQFNHLVKTELFPKLQEYGFELKEEFKNILRYQSLDIKINFIFNEKEMSCIVEIGKNSDITYPLNDIAVFEVFNASIAIDNVNPKKFIENLSILFGTDEGVKILEGNVETLIKILKRQSESFTAKLLLKQKLNISDKAWKENNYSDFIENIDKIGITNVPITYQLKYKMAKRKINNSK